MADGDQSFEHSLDELSELVARLESGDLPLEEALAAYERGVRLVREAQSRLEAAELRIAELRVDADGVGERIVELGDAE